MVHIYNHTFHTHTHTHVNKSNDQQHSRSQQLNIHGCLIVHSASLPSFHPPLTKPTAVPTLQPNRQTASHPSHQARHTITHNQMRQMNSRNSSGHSRAGGDKRRETYRHTEGEEWHTERQRDREPETSSFNLYVILRYIKYTHTKQKQQ